MKASPVLWLCASLLSAPAPIPDNTPDAKQLVRKFENAYRPARTLRADFLERYLDNGKEARAESGVAYFSKPGKMRWEYAAPERNLYVVDGKYSWFYVPADRTVTRITAKQSADARTPLALLAGEMKVSRICQRVELEESRSGNSGDTAQLRCVLRGTDENASSVQDAAKGNGTSGDYALFEIAPSSGELRQVLVAESGGIQIEFRFANWSFSPNLKAEQFRFTVPQGVAIVDGDLRGAGGQR